MIRHAERQGSDWRVGELHSDYQPLTNEPINTTTIHSNEFVGSAVGNIYAIAHVTTFLMSIPIIDFAPWTHDASEEHRGAVSTELVKACREVGFAYIVNHGVPQDALDHAFAISKRFYDLSQEEKMKAPHPPGWAHHRGYSWAGLEKVSAVGAQKDDRALVDQLRSITDCKVIDNYTFSPVPLVLPWREGPSVLNSLFRKVMRLAQTTIQTSRTSGCHN